MPDEPTEHPAADRAMQWLGENWYVPIVVAIDLALIARPHGPPPKHVSADHPSVEQHKEPEIDMER